VFLNLKKIAYTKKPTSMRNILCLLVFILICKTNFSQQKLHDGIYLVDSPTSKKHVPETNGKAFIRFNHAFVTEDPDNYEQLVVQTNNYFSFERAGQPVVQNRKKENALLLLQLTAAAKEELTAFTAHNLLKNVVVVVNDEALAVYKITRPVTDGLIKITTCNGQACNQILKNLKSSRKI
jgi:hypothetical protein